MTVSSKERRTAKKETDEHSELRFLWCCIHCLHGAICVVKPFQKSVIVCVTSSSLLNRSADGVLRHLVYAIEASFTLTVGNYTNKQAAAFPRASLHNTHICPTAVCVPAEPNSVKIGQQIWEFRVDSRALHHCRCAVSTKSTLTQ